MPDYSRGGPVLTPPPPPPPAQLDALWEQAWRAGALADMAHSERCWFPQFVSAPPVPPAPPPQPRRAAPRLQRAAPEPPATLHVACPRPRQPWRTLLPPSRHPVVPPRRACPDPAAGPSGAVGPLRGDPARRRLDRGARVLAGSAPSCAAARPLCTDRTRTPPLPGTDRTRTHPSAPRPVPPRADSPARAQRPGYTWDPSAVAYSGAPPPPPSRTNRTRRVPHPVLIGHAASLSQVSCSSFRLRTPPPAPSLPPPFPPSDTPRNNSLGAGAHGPPSRLRL